MPPMVRVGAILIEDWPLMTQLRGMESEPYAGNWRLVKVLDGFALDRNVRAAGWNLFFMASEVRAIFFGGLGTAKFKKALTKILGKVQKQGFNGVEVTKIVAKHFLGVPYGVVSAHSRHVQQSCYLDNTNTRRTSHHDAEWARG